jgi:endonuclease-8
MPEGDTIELAARRLEPLAGQPLQVETPHPRHRHDRIPERLAGAELAQVEARGKHLLLTFSNGLTLHSHLRMRGRWDVYRPGQRWGRSPARAWLVLRTAEHVGVLFDGPVLELLTPAQLSLHPVLRRLGEDLIDDDLDVDRVLRALRREDPGREVGDALLDQRVLAGIGNVWKSEALHAEAVGPFRPLGTLDDATLRRVVERASEGMRGQVELGHGRRPRAVYDRAGRPCPRCGSRIASRVQGDDGRTTFWCPGCQT